MGQFKDLKINILMLMAMLTWGLSWTNAKIVGQYADATLVMTWRFFFASLSMIPIMMIYKINFRVGNDSLKLIFFNCIYMISYNYFYFKGTQVGLAGLGGVLVTTLNPILTTLFASLFFHKKLLIKEIVGLLIGITGGALIMRFWEMEFPILLLSGNLFFLLASLSWVAVTINTSQLSTKTSYITYSFWTYIFSFVICIIFGSNESLLIIFEYDWLFWINLISLSIFAMSFGTSIYFLASSKLGPTRASAYIYLVPMTAMGFAIYFLAEPLYFSTILGGALGILAIYIINQEKS